MNGASENLCHLGVILNLVCFRLVTKPVIRGTSWSRVVVVTLSIQSKDRHLEVMTEHVTSMMKYKVGLVLTSEMLLCSSVLVTLWLLIHKEILSDLVVSKFGM